jgi:hypothetical protein
MAHSVPRFGLGQRRDRGGLENLPFLEENAALALVHATLSMRRSPCATGYTFR